MYTHTCVLGIERQGWSYKSYLKQKRVAIKLPLIVGSWFTSADLHAGEVAQFAGTDLCVAARSELDVVVVGARMGLVCLIDV